MSTDSARNSQVTPACHAASVFVDYLNARDFEAIGKLFADPTDVTGPDGTNHHHPTDVVSFMRHGFKAMTTQWSFRIRHVAPVGENGCLLQFEVSEDGGPFEAAAVDHFELNAEGKIIKFLPYIASSRVAKTAELQRKVKAAREAAQSARP